MYHEDPRRRRWEDDLLAIQLCMFLCQKIPAGTNFPSRNLLWEPRFLVLGLKIAMTDGLLFALILYSRSFRLNHCLFTKHAAYKNIIYFPQIHF